MSMGKGLEVNVRTKQCSIAFATGCNTGTSKEETQDQSQGASVAWKGRAQSQDMCIRLVIGQPPASAI